MRTLPTPLEVVPARRRTMQFSDHAKARMGEFGLSQDQVLDLIENAETQYDLNRSRPGFAYHCAGWKVITGTAHNQPIVVTVMRMGRDYEHDYPCLHCEHRVEFQYPHGWLHLDGSRQCQEQTSTATPNRSVDV